MRELFQNTYVENDYLIQNYKDFRWVQVLGDCIWSDRPEESWVQLPKRMFTYKAEYDSITVPSYILYNDTYHQVYLPNNCSNLFYNCNAKCIDLHYIIDTSNVNNMGSMFVGCKNLTNLDLSNFDTSNVTGMACMFLWCPAGELYKDDKRFREAYLY